jgi:transposase
MEVKRVVTEYRVEILEDEWGKRIRAKFSEGVVQATLYGEEVEAQTVYRSVQQLIPSDRVGGLFASQLDIPLSEKPPSITTDSNAAGSKLPTVQTFTVRTVGLRD